MCTFKPLQPACTCLRSLFLSGVSSLFDDEFLETMISDKNTLHRLECAVIKSEVSFFLDCIQSYLFLLLPGCFNWKITQESFKVLFKH